MSSIGSVCGDTSRYKVANNHSHYLLDSSDGQKTGTNDVTQSETNLFGANDDINCEQMAKRLDDKPFKEYGTAVNVRYKPMAPTDGPMAPMAHITKQKKCKNKTKNVTIGRPLGLKSSQRLEPELTAKQLARTWDKYSRVAYLSGRCPHWTVGWTCCLPTTRTNEYLIDRTPDSHRNQKRSKVFNKCKPLSVGQYGSGQCGSVGPDVSTGATNLFDLNDLYVKGLDRRLTEEVLHETFNKYGSVEKLWYESGSYDAIISYANPLAPIAAISALKDKTIANVTIGNCTLKMYFSPDLSQIIDYNGMPWDRYSRVVNAYGECAHWRLGWKCANPSTCTYEHNHINWGIDMRPDIYHNKYYHLVDITDRKIIRKKKQMVERVDGTDDVAVDKRKVRLKNKRLKVSNSATNLFGLNGLCVKLLTKGLNRSLLNETFSQFGTVVKIECKRNANHVFIGYSEPMAPIAAINAFKNKIIEHLNSDEKPILMFLKPDSSQKASYNAMSWDQYSLVVNKWGECAHWRLGIKCPNARPCAYKHIGLNRAIDMRPKFCKSLQKVLKRM